MMNENPKIDFAAPVMGDIEREALQRVLDGNILTDGANCAEFERGFEKFTGGGRALTVSSCMAALHLSYLNFGIGAEDEVIVPAQTHTATAHAVEIVGARPVFVDADPATGNMRPELIEKAVTPNTRAIGLVHFQGIPCDMERIMRIAQANDFVVIEDCALAMGAFWEGKHVGLWGDAGCFSFYPAKHITTGEGGMLLSKNDEFIACSRKIRGFGVDKTYGERQIPGMYDVDELGLNYRMSEFQAAVGKVQVRRLPDILEKRERNFNIYAESFKNVKNLRIVKADNKKAKSAYYGLSIILEGTLSAKRNEILARLKKMHVGCSVYYPQPVPRMAYYRNKYGYNPENYPNAELISDCSITLPVGPHLSESDVEYVAQTVKDIIGGCKS